MIHIYKVVSLFSGAGGMDLGFIRQGFEIIWANDFDKSACETYKHNIGNHIIHGDITQIKSEDIPDCDIVIGGSPCQGFSNSNRNKENRFLDNPKNLLVKEFIRVVKDKKPKVFVLENVPQILTAGDGRFLREIENELSNYKITSSVLSADDYGVAQKRQRAIIIGSLFSKIEHPLPTHQTPITVQEVLETIKDIDYNQQDYSSHTPLAVERIKYVPQGGNIQDIPEDIRPKGGMSCTYKRLESNKPSITIVNVRKNMILHPTEHRILSVRESAAIQSFPNDFEFLGNLSDKQQQVCNAVPPLLAETIAKQIKDKV